MHKERNYEHLQVREKSARCGETMQNDDNSCKTSALVSDAFERLNRRSATG
jgi:hypothetical protein